MSLEILAFLSNHKPKLIVVDFFSGHNHGFTSLCLVWSESTACFFFSSCCYFQCTLSPPQECLAVNLLFFFFFFIPSPTCPIYMTNSWFRCRFFLMLKSDKRLEKWINEVWKTMGWRDEKPLHCVQSIKTRRNRRDTLISVLLVLTLMAIIGGMMLYLFHWLKLFSCWEKSILGVVGWQRHHFRIDGGCQTLSLVDFCSLLRF